MTLIHRMADRFLLVALAGFLCWKGILTFVIEPLVAGPHLQEYVTPVTELLLGLFIMYFVLSKHWTKALIGAGVLVILGTGYWFFVDKAVRTDFQFFVAPNLAVFVATLIIFATHFDWVLASRTRSHS